MLSEDVIQCICCAKNWEPRGASISPSFSDQTFRCLSCGADVWILSGYGCGPLALFHPRNMTKETEDWVNGPMMAQWRLTKDEFDKTHPYVEGKPEWPETPLPPRMPRGLVGFLGNRGADKAMTWKGPYNYENTMNVIAPEDPIFTRHKEHWTKLLAELGVKEYQTARNQYCGSRLEPWYEFILHGTRVIVGPRKRVDVIEVDNTIPFDCVALKDIAAKDNVTFTGNGIHAWSREKFVEYFRIVERYLQNRLPPTQDERINLIESKRHQLREEEARHEQALHEMRSQLRMLINLPHCTHQEKDGSSARENVSDHGSSYKCRYCELM